VQIFCAFFSYLSLVSVCLKGICCFLKKIDLEVRVKFFVCIKISFNLQKCQVIQSLINETENKTYLLDSLAGRDFPWIDDLLAGVQVRLFPEKFPHL
jgi:hypothetical protein